MTELTYDKIAALMNGAVANLRRVVDSHHFTEAPQARRAAHAMLAAFHEHAGEAIEAQLASAATFQARA
jgi:hypothetical protein